MLAVRGEQFESFTESLCRASCGPLTSEEKNRLKRWKNRLQLSCNLHGL